jgi:hypothetical protein
VGVARPHENRRRRLLPGELHEPTLTVRVASERSDDADAGKVAHDAHLTILWRVRPAAVASGAIWAQHVTTSGGEDRTG